MSYNPNNRNYNEPRKKLRKNLRRIDIFFRYSKNFNALNILFPHRWQLQPKKSDENFGKLKDQNLKKRTQILKEVVKYVLETRRFKNDIGY